jgi:hypothetical protein
VNNIINIGLTQLKEELKKEAEETRGFLLASIALTLSATAHHTLPGVGTPFSFVRLFVVALSLGQGLWSH